MKHTKCTVKCEVKQLEATCTMDLGPGPFTIQIIGKNVDIKLFEVIAIEIEESKE